ncbi:glycosyltransferase family 9 protein [Planctomycetota bacterium]
MVKQLGPGIDKAHGAFTDTAAIIANLDLVVTSDTAILHLAAAMGKPVWMATSNSPDWRWPSTGSTSIWYPTIRLFHQSKPGDWQTVFANICQALAPLVKKSIDDQRM